MVFKKRKENEENGAKRATGGLSLVLPCFGKNSAQHCRAVKFGTGCSLVNPVSAEVLSE